MKGMRNMRDPAARAAPEGGRLSKRYTLFRLFLIVLSKALFGLTVTGAGKVPKEGAVILACNHRSYADPVLICLAVRRRIWWMAKKEVFAGPALQWFFHFIGSFPVDRAGGGRAALRTSLKLLEGGWTLGVFPEGTRRKPGDARGNNSEDAKNGVALIATRSAAPVFPVFISPIPNPLDRLKGEKLHIRIGEPIILRNEDAKRVSYAEGAGRVMRGIYALERDDVAAADSLSREQGP